MKRRTFLAASLALPLAARAQGQAARRTLGLLWNDSVQPSPHMPVLLGSLHKLGWTAGRNLEVKDHVALEGYRPMAQSAATLAQQGCHAIVTYGVTATTMAARATREIPIVTVMGTDPVVAGLASSLARPGGNVTGVSLQGTGLIRKRIELLKEMVPGLARIGLVYAGGGTGRAITQQEVEAAAKVLKLQVQLAEIAGPEGIEPGIAALAKGKAGAVYVSGNVLLASHAERVTAALAKHRLPAAYATERYIAAGGLMVYTPSVGKAFARAASYVDLIFRGARPAEMPIEQLGDVELTINLKTARELGLRFPQSILQRSDRAIE